MMMKIKDSINFAVRAYWLPVSLVAGIVVLLWTAENDEQRRVAYEVSRKNIICPSLLSIGRSARDTLIIMKAEYLCKDFVLDSLK